MLISQPGALAITLLREGARMVSVADYLNAIASGLRLAFCRLVRC